MLVLAVLGIFLPTLGFPFLQYDEQHQLVGNPLVRSLGPANVARIFTSFSITNYYPVRVLSFAVDYQIWGLRAAGFRLTNILLHLANTLLVFALVVRVSRRAGGDPFTDRARCLAALAAAGLFAFHPVVVEPVVWIAGREELLMVFFVLLGIHCHISAQGATSSSASSAGPLSFARGSSVHQPGFHLLAGICIACACMSNVVAAAVPMIVTAYDGVIHRSVRRALAGTWFLWLISVGAVVAKKTGERIARELGVLTKQGLHLAPAERVRAVFDGYWMNIKSLVWPRDLAAMYPKTVPESFLAPTVLAGVALAVVTLLLLWRIRRLRGALFGVLWFVLALAPSSQVVPHHIHHADRFLYLPLVGVSLAIGVGLMRLSAARLPPGILIGIPAATLAVLGARSAVQAQYWRDGATLFHRSVDLYPNVADARNNLGLSLRNRGEWDRAAEHLSVACRLQPADADVQFNLGVVRLELGDHGSAIEHLARATELKPGAYDAHYFLGKARLALNELELAAASLATAVKLNPTHAESRQLLGDTLLRQGRIRQAVEQYRAALALQPDWPVVANNLAWILATDADDQLRNGAEAVKLAEHAIRIAGQDDPRALDTLAAAYAEAGRFDDAVRAVERAINLAARSGDTPLVAELQTRLDLYRARHPFRQPATRPT